MGEVNKRPVVIRDLIDLATYIAVDNLDASDRFLVAAEETFKQLANMPRMGKLCRFSHPILTGIRQLALKERDIRNLYRFIGWIMILPTGLEAEFWQEFKQFEQERKMSYITTGERIGYERGKLEGKVEGKLEGKVEGKLEGEQLLILRQLQRRVGTLSEFVKERIQSLSVTQLEALGEALLDFTVIDDLLNWLEVNQSQ